MSNRLICLKRMEQVIHQMGELGQKNKQNQNCLAYWINKIIKFENAEVEKWMRLQLLPTSLEVIEEVEEEAEPNEVSPKMKESSLRHCSCHLPIARNQDPIFQAFGPYALPIFSDFDLKNVFNGEESLELETDVSSTGETTETNNNSTRQNLMEPNFKPQ